MMKERYEILIIALTFVAAYYAGAIAVFVSQASVLLILIAQKRLKANLNLTKY